MTPAVRMRGVTKLFGQAKALDGIDLEVAPGASVGLSGPNGAGRTTLLHLAAALRQPTSGTIDIVGVDAAKSPFDARLHVMFVGTTLAGGTDLRVGEYVDFIGTARRARIPPLVKITPTAALERAGLSAESRVDTLSTGLRKRLALATALVASPAILLFDDPFASLDPTAREGFIDWINESRAAGTTIITAVNEADEAAALCDAVYRMEHGRIVSRSSTVTASSPPVARAVGGR